MAKLTMSQESDVVEYIAGTRYGHLIPADATACAMGYVAGMTEMELIDAWLRYNGIIGYTEQIVDLVERAFDTRLRPF